MGAARIDDPDWRLGWRLGWRHGRVRPRCSASPMQRPRNHIHAPTRARAIARTRTHTETVRIGAARLPVGVSGASRPDLRMPPPRRVGRIFNFHIVLASSRLSC